MRESPLDANRLLWDELVSVHAAGGFYDLAAFRAGASTLRPIEVREVGDVDGKRLLHLQCHFGMDSISWARRGASVVGVDFSPAAIDLARELAREEGVAAEFVCSDLYDLPDKLVGTFDVVFTSYGVLTWLPDLDRWASVVARYVAAEGTFYIVEQHPVGGMLEEHEGHLIASEPYFNVGPMKDESDGSYADRDAALEHRLSFQWQHSLSDVITALTSAGLQIEFLHEFPFCSFQWLPSMVQDRDGWWRLPDRDDVPFLFSLKASRSAA
jgi:SAM-dependent methyltransferase